MFCISRDSFLYLLAHGIGVPVSALALGAFVLGLVLSYCWFSSRSGRGH